MIIDKSSPEGNAFFIMAQVRHLLEEVGRGNEWPAIRKKLMSGNYENLCKIAEKVTHGSITVRDYSDGEYSGDE